MKAPLDPKTRVERATTSVITVSVLSMGCHALLAGLLMDPPGTDYYVPPDQDAAQILWGYTLIGLLQLIVASQLKSFRWRRIGLVVAVANWIPFGTVLACGWPFALVAGIQLWRALRDPAVAERFAAAPPRSTPNLIVFALVSSTLIGCCVWVGYSATRLPRVSHYARQAIGELKSLGTAQLLFQAGDKEGDGELDFGTLAELHAAGLLKRDLGAGWERYRYKLVVDPKAPEYRWLAVAIPQQQEDLHLAINHEGKVYESETGFPLNPDCQIVGGVPIGR